VAEIAGDIYYTIDDAEFGIMVVERMKQLERERLVRVIQIAEMGATRSTVHPGELAAFEHDYDSIVRQIHEIDARREAIRGLTHELDKPKTD
jgi:hypothetical protein